MGKVGYNDWNKIVETKEASLKVIEANERNLEVGKVIETLALKKAIEERDKYPKPEEEVLEDKPESA